MHTRTCTCGALCDLLGATPLGQPSFGDSSPRGSWTLLYVLGELFKGAGGGGGGVVVPLSAEIRSSIIRNNVTMLSPAAFATPCHWTRGCLAAYSAHSPTLPVFRDALTRALPSI